jgi:S1-C subfamily serine protease
MSICKSGLAGKAAWSGTLTCCFIFLFAPRLGWAQPLSKDQLELVRAFEQSRIEAIDKVIGSVIAIYDEDRQGGGSGVVIDPSGIALTNHHVIIGAGVSGWGGLSDGQLYHWKLVGTDPGGDVAIIQLEGRDEFPYTPLGDSDEVRVGDWALAMGNPFLLTEDQKPTVTLGIVSGVKRYQYGAGQNQLVYGNCIQVDSSINPGNSGGPLFNMFGEVIGINGRGSFQDRGRVNVGLGYAISSNQIKNFIPDLLATKLVEHGTLDASFSERGGKVVCSTINELAPIYESGLRLGDELLKFEGVAIDNANQFTNLICTLPEGWPAHLEIRTGAGDPRSIHSRLLGLPYAKPQVPQRKPDQGGSEEEEKQLKRQYEMLKLLTDPPGTVRYPDLNRQYAEHFLHSWVTAENSKRPAATQALLLTDEIRRGDQAIGSRQMWLAPSGEFVINEVTGDESSTIKFDGKTFRKKSAGTEAELTLTEAKLETSIVEALGILASQMTVPFRPFGDLLIDGSDKAQNQNAIRFKMTDQDEDWFYFWTSMYDTTGHRSVRLLKASPDMDCNDHQGVCFYDWQTEEGWNVPANRRHVRGLSEEGDVSVTLRASKLVPLDDVVSLLE